VLRWHDTQRDGGAKLDVKMRHREDGEASAPFYRAGDEVNGREAFDR
jgi:hypothetical protein